MTAINVADQQFHFDLPAGRVDDGLFGPGSVSWRVWSHPAAIVGAMRSFVVDMVASAQGAAALEDHSHYRHDPLGRLSRTFYYFLTAVFADTATVARANQRLDRMHARIVGIEPMSGQPYSAMDPYLRLGNHMMSWHSVFFAYQTLVGDLTAAEEDQFFAEAAVAFDTFGIEYDDIRASALRHGIPEHRLSEHIPCTRSEYRELFAASRHLICVTEQTRSALDAILHPQALDGDPVRAALFRVYPILARAGLALIPRNIRHTSGLPTSRRGDTLAIGAARTMTALLHRTGTYPLLLKRLSPKGYQVQTSALRGSNRLPSETPQKANFHNSRACEGRF